MTSDLIRDALAAASDTAAVVVGPGVVEQTGPTFTTVFPGRRAVVVADETTWAVAGPQVTGSLRAAGAELEAPVVYPGHPVALGLVGMCRLGEVGVDPEHPPIVEAQHHHAGIREIGWRRIQHLHHRRMRREDPDRFFSAHGPDHTCGTPGARRATSTPANLRRSDYKGHRSQGGRSSATAESP